MSSRPAFVETKPYERFREFCDACRRDRYIGLCYGPPGVGKTLSARRYTGWDKIEAYKKDPAGGVSLSYVLGSSSILYTAKVVSSPRRVEEEISGMQKTLRGFLVEDLHRQREAQCDASRQRLKTEEMVLCADQAWTPRRFKEIENETLEALRQIDIAFGRRCQEAEDPTTLIVIDEADRLKMSALEQIRDIFDRSGVGVVLIGMPGIEKRLARYPQLYSRIGFVHEFRCLAETEVRGLLTQGWLPDGVALPGGISDEEALVAVLRITEGNFRLLNRLLAQIARVLAINNLQRVTLAVVQVARESLVIGAA